LHFKYMTVSSNESDMRAQAAMTFKVTTLKAKAKTYKAKASSHWPQASAEA